MSETSGLLRLSALWQAEVGRRARRVAFAAVVLALVVAAHVGRRGTLPNRIGGSALVAGVVVLAVLRGVRERRRLLTPEGIIRGVLGATNPDAAARALRAHELVRETQVNSASGSPELAALHFRRVVERVPPESVRSSAMRHAARLAWTLLALVLAIGALTLPDPMRIVEGLDIIAARRGIAPLEMPQLELLRASSQPPSYLHESERALMVGAATEQPEGSVISVHGIPLRPGRRLVLTDGQHETEFVDDGNGGVVARFKLEADRTLHVAARFGGVLIRESESLELKALRDEAPQIELAGAPRTLPLEEVDGFELRYAVEDDHGLRQIDLVLRSGSHEDRRSLVKLDGQSREEQGAHALSPRDPFLRRAFLPVIATIQARDNDPTHAARWGESKAITILPPDVGAPQAQRFTALKNGENQLIALLDLALADERERRARPVVGGARERREQLLKQKSLVVNTLRQAVAANYGSLKVSSGLSAFVLGQARLLDAARDEPRRRIEDALLALDAGLMALAQRDATAVAKRLGDLAEEVADAARATFASEQRDLGRKRFDTALDALDRGVRNLLVLGALGADVGSVAQGEIRRIRRAAEANSFSDAELAARHLAARLRRPSPSFSAGGGGGGVESGRGTQGGQGNASDADQQFDQLMHELERLAEDHAEQIRQVEGTLSEADQSEGSEELKREAAERAARLRAKLAELPEPGAPQGSGRAAAAIAREHLNAMAQNLERLSLKDALENGKSARGELAHAKRRAQAPESASDWLDENAVAEANRELADDIGWTEQALEKAKRERARALEKDLNSAAEREDSLARRASNLSGRGEHSEAQLPEDVQESLERAESTMRQASRALRTGETDEAQNLQAEAQRLLEHASPGRTEDEQDQGDNRGQGGGDDKGQPATQGSVPGVNKRRRSEDFRKRVLEGLAKERRGALAPAVERYAEGLLE